VILRTYLDDMQAEKVPDVVEVAAGKQPLGDMIIHFWLTCVFLYSVFARYRRAYKGGEVAYSETR
jgi:hypothetical protein